MKEADVNEVSLCGVFCGGCPAFHKKRCHGCRSENKNQPRISKWKCKLRNCVISKNLISCHECEEFPCKKRNYLVKRYKEKYTIDLNTNITLLANLGINRWLKAQHEKYLCKHCGGTCSPYTGKCLNC
jgi:hypothetical protein